MKQINCLEDSFGRAKTTVLVGYSVKIIQIYEHFDCANKVQIEQC